MKQTTVEIDDLADHLSLLPDADTSSWPVIELSIDFRTHSAEPDVGIFHEQIEVLKVTYELDGVSYTDETAFIADLYDRISGDIEDGIDALTTCIRAAGIDWEQSYEGDDGDDRDDDRD